MPPSAVHSHKRHSGAERSEEPGIHNHRSGRTRAEIVLLELWLWIPDLPPTKSAVADLDFLVSISGKPEIDGNPE